MIGGFPAGCGLRVRTAIYCRFSRCFRFSRWSRFVVTRLPPPRLSSTSTQAGWLEYMSSAKRVGTPIDEPDAPNPLQVPSLNYFLPTRAFAMFLVMSLLLYSVLSVDCAPWTIRRQSNTKTNNPNNNSRSSITGHPVTNQQRGTTRTPRPITSTDSSTNPLLPFHREETAGRLGPRFVPPPRGRSTAAAVQRQRSLRRSGSQGPRSGTPCLALRPVSTVTTASVVVVMGTAALLTTARVVARRWCRGGRTARRGTRGQPGGR